ncbi:adenylosuccinate lyase [Spiroplasma attinicola]|uniref:adenylosuccinate lyase n=1 Tax=Spiroplasma attinicola TaxID=2904537 RepID=UPI002022B459|nr:MULTISPECIES: adenylosuccinate lyase [unclassified Spiroplasma]MCL8210196.1 Adenylosuccinate lyase [Spiroplasma sp. JKS002670]MCL8210703.1 Adenylosuccinate lyase [Spiroplasma sp. JKS002671]
MIERYQTEAMNKIWNDENRFNLWLQFQIDVAEALSQLNYFPKSDFLKIKNHAKLNLPLMKKLEIETKHDVVAFTRMLSASLKNESRWIHYGLTSTDMVDSVQNYQIKQANVIISNDILDLQKKLKELAIRYKNQPIIARTHGIFAEPTSLGLKFALWYDELNRQLARLDLAKTQIEVVKITGSVGNFAHVSPKVSEIVAKKWKMTVDSCATQVVQRDRHSFLLTTLANIASTIEKIALEIRLSQRSEVNELAEGFALNQKGSSSMPHKKNPIASENIVGLSRLIRTYVNVSFENNLLWYERDISHSSNERVIFPDVYHALDFIGKRMVNVLENLVVNTGAINENLRKANDLYFSQPVLLAIIKNNPKLTREAAYDFIQNASLIAQKENQNFKDVLQANKIDKYLTQEQLIKCYDEKQFLVNVDYIFNKVFK